jgi:hypothetical protein
VKRGGRGAEASPSCGGQTMRRQKPRRDRSVIDPLIMLR